RGPHRSGGECSAPPAAVAGGCRVGAEAAERGSGMKLTIHGVRYHVEVDGDGPALLLLHGFTGSAAVWEPFVNAWSRWFRVIRVDIIGHGRTDAPKDPSRYQMKLVAADLEALLEQLG